MINQTILSEEIIKKTTELDMLTYISNTIYIPSIVAYWIFQYLLTMIIGYGAVKEDKGKFFAIFIFTQLVGAIILFFIFIYPIIPTFLDRWF